jgi:protein AFG1
MVGVINPSGSNTQANLASAAKNAQTVSAPSAVFGGVIGPAAGGSSTSSGAPAATTSPSSGGGGGGAYGGSGNNAGTVGISLALMGVAAGFALYLT